MCVSSPKAPAPPPPPPAPPKAPTPVDENVVASRKKARRGLTGVKKQTLLGGAIEGGVQQGTAKTLLGQ